MELRNLLSHAGCANVAARPLVEYLETYLGEIIPLTKTASFPEDEKDMSDLVDFRNQLIEAYSRVDGEIKVGGPISKLFKKHAEREAIGKAMKQTERLIRMQLKEKNEKRLEKQ